MQLKEPLEAGLNAFGLGVGQGSGFEHVAAAFVSHRQRLAETFGIVPPALEVHRPDVVAGRGHLLTTELSTEAGPAFAPLLTNPQRSKIRLMVLSLGPFPCARW